MGYQKNLEYIKKLNDQFRYYKTIESIFEQDQWSALPLEGGAYRQQVASHIAMQKAGLFDSEDAKKAEKYFSEVNLNEIEDDIERGLIRSFLFRYRNQTRIPKDVLYQYNMLRAETMNKWKEAREKQDFAVFSPWLSQVFELKKQMALSVNPDVPAFDTLVNMTDEGTSCEEISCEFDILKEGLTNLRKKIEASSIKADDAIFVRPVEPVRLQEFAKRLARETGYQESRGGFNDKGTL